MLAFFLTGLIGGGAQAGAAPAGGAIIVTSPFKNIFIPSNNVNDYQGYIVLNSTAISLSYDNSEFGEPSVKGEITGASAIDNETNLPHRGYGFIHLDEYPVGPLKTPCKVSFRVWLDITLSVRPGIDDWFSFATLAADSVWGGLFAVNLNPQGYVYLQHTPSSELQVHTYQAGPDNDGPPFPMRQWVDLDIIYDGNPSTGTVSVLQNRVEVSSASITSGNGLLTRVHLGMYASPMVSSGLVLNKFVILQELVPGGVEVGVSRTIGLYPNEPRSGFGYGLKVPPGGSGYRPEVISS